MRTFRNINKGDIVIYAPDLTNVEAQDIATGYVKEITDIDEDQVNIVVEIPKYNLTYNLDVDKDNTLWSVIGGGWIYTTIEECVENELGLNEF